MSQLKLNSAVFSSVGIALLPKLACPACWPAYAGLLGSVGLGFLIQSEWLLPLTAVFLSVAMFALAYKARQRRGYGPFLLGFVAAVTVLIGKFYFESDMTMYAGLATLVSASLWNTWPIKYPAEPCAACEGTGPE